MFIQKMKPFIEAVLVGKKVIVSISQIKNMKKGVGLTLGENLGLKDGYHRKKGGVNWDKSLRRRSVFHQSVSLC